MKTVLSMSLQSFFKKCHRPVNYKAEVKALRIHDVLSLGGIRVSDGKDGFHYGQAYIKKEEKDRYSLTGIWTVVTKPSRKDMWMQGSFSLNKGRVNFENGMTKDHLRAFFKICRYLGVHKRAEKKRSQQARRQWIKASDALRTESYRYQLPVKEHYGSWFFAQDIEPLFCGEVLSGLCLNRGYRCGKVGIDIDVRDRMCTQAIIAMAYKDKEFI